MKKSNRSLLSLFVLTVLLSVSFISGEKVYGQEITIRLNQPPPDQLGIADLWRATITNTTKETYRVYLYGILTEKTAGIIATATTVDIDIKPGVTNLKAGDFPKQPDVSYSGNSKYKEALFRTGNVPTGDYEYCVHVKLKQNNTELGNDCLSQPVSDAEMISLITPGNEDEINPNTLITFSWISSKPKQGAVYTLKIVEILNSQTPETAMKQNKAFFVKENINSTTFNYPNAAAMFQAGKKYAWSVTAVVKSEISSFNVISDNLKIDSAVTDKFGKELIIVLNDKTCDCSSKWSASKIVSVSTASTGQIIIKLNYDGYVWSGTSLDGYVWNGSSWDGYVWDGTTMEGYVWNGSSWDGYVWNGTSWDSYVWDGTTWNNNPGTINLNSDGYVWNGTSWDKNAGPINITFPGYVCTSANCEPQYYKWQIDYNGTSSPLTQTTDLTVPFNYTNSGTYVVKFYPYCGDKICDSCFVTIIKSANDKYRGD